MKRALPALLLIAGLLASVAANAAQPTVLVATTLGLSLIGAAMRRRATVPVRA